jgi:hypothetical protein
VTTRTQPATRTGQGHKTVEQPTDRHRRVETIGSRKSELSLCWAFPPVPTAGRHCSSTGKLAICRFQTCVGRNRHHGTARAPSRPHPPPAGSRRARQPGPPGGLGAAAPAPRERQQPTTHSENRLDPPRRDPGSTRRRRPGSFRRAPRRDPGVRHGRLHGRGHAQRGGCDLLGVRDQGWDGAADSGAICDVLPPIEPPLPPGVRPAPSASAPARAIRCGRRPSSKPHITAVSPGNARGPSQSWRVPLPLTIPCAWLKPTPRIPTSISHLYTQVELHSACRGDLRIARS